MCATSIVRNERASSKPKSQAFYTVPEDIKE